MSLEATKDNCGGYQQQWVEWQYAWVKVEPLLYAEWPSHHEEIRQVFEGNTLGRYRVILRHDVEIPIPLRIVWKEQILTPRSEPTPLNRTYVSVYAAGIKPGHFKN